MNLEETIQRLRAEVDVLERVIKTLEELQCNSLLLPKPPPKRRGRKSMNPAERQEVSERMRKYWASRRQGDLGVDLTKVIIPPGQPIS